MLLNHHECRLPSLDEEEDDADDDGNSIGNVDDLSSSVLCLYWIVCALCRGSSKENILLKNSYDAKKIAPWDIYITNLGVNPLIRKLRIRITRSYTDTEA